jgi:hypothetical protein
MLPDGRAVVPGYKSPDDEVWVHCYEAGSTTILSWSYKILGSAYANYSDACVLINGNIVVMWVDNVSPENAYFAILDTDGGLVKGMTSCEPLDEYLANYSEPNHVIALADGGFFCYWMLDDTYPSGSVFDADGTVRVDYYWYGSEIEPAAPIQMPVSGGGTYAGWLVVSDSVEYNALRFVNQADMEDQVTNIAPYISSNPDWIYMASPPAWTDRIAVIWNFGATIQYMIVDDEGASDGSHNMWSGPPVSREIYDLVQLPDGNLLMMYYGVGSTNGTSYYILDTSDDSELTILSGPHTAFTGLTAEPDPACHGCANNTSSSSSSTSSSSRSSSSSSSSSS